MPSLEEYRRKRDFERTPEPTGPDDLVAELVREAQQQGLESGEFVIQKHDARNLHYDLRLEMGGVYKSWAVPKGPSLTPGEKRLAVHVEDHPLEYGEFEGVIPEGEYGGGTVMLWDRGRWAATKLKGKAKSKNKNKSHGDMGHIDFVLLGEKLRGVWTLVRTAGRLGNKADNWLLIKRRDTTRGTAEGESSLTDLSVATGRTMQQIAADRDRTWTQDGEASSHTQRLPDIAGLKGARHKAMPKSLKPALAQTKNQAPAGDEWLHEIKFDGYRILARYKSGAITLLSRSGRDWTKRFLEIAKLLRNPMRKLNIKNAVLDGEVMALSADGTSSFRTLQEAISKGDTRGLIYQVFDLIYYDGYDLTAVPLTERKRFLAELLSVSGFTSTASIRYTDHIQGQGPAFAEQACRLGLEGIICKRADGAYGAGQRKNWLKVKCTEQEELIICGFTDPAGQRSGFGALLLAAWDGNQLVYAGRVGTGFTERLLVNLYRCLRELEVAQSPLASPPTEKDIHWVRPQLVAEIEFKEWTREGVLRHSSFKGLRDDLDPQDIQLPQAARHLERDHAQPVTQRTSGLASTARTRGKGETAQVAGVTLTNPNRVLYPDQGITKLQLAQFYEDIEPWVLSQIAYRPLSLVRCPEGYTKNCFFQKHPHSVVTESIPRVQIADKQGREPYLYIEKPADIITLVQAGVLELHVWGSRIEDVEHPDILVFDLDPGPSVHLMEIQRVARDLRQRLRQLGLESFVRTTGGKGLHLVVPVVPQKDWGQVKAFCQAVARQHAQDDRTRVTANMAKSKRYGKIFMDYLRNGRGATAIGSYSTRARAGAPVAVPVTWDELTEALTPDRYNVETLRRRLAVLRTDPWQDFEAARKPLTNAMLRAVDVL